MKHVDYIPKGVCSRKISFDITDNNTITGLKFEGGCSGNLKAICKLLEGAKPEDVIKTLSGNTCGPKNTSCTDQLTKALVEATQKN